MRSVYCTALALVFVASLAGAPPDETAGPRGGFAAPQAASGPADFKVFIRGVQIGTESVSVAQTPAGTIISGSGRMSPPVDVTTNRCEVRYDSQWRPVELGSDAIIHGQYTLIHAVFTGGSAALQVVVSGKQTNTTAKAEPDAVILVSSFFGLYEALAARLGGLRQGDRLPGYLVPQNPIEVEVGALSDERIQTPARTIATRHYSLTLSGAGTPIQVDLWSDEANRLVRLSMPSQSLEFVREDVSSVASRREIAPPRAGDEQVRIPANGFSLVATVSQPAGATKPAKGKPIVRYPAVVLVGASVTADRDELVAGVPIFAQLAGGLADAGFLVIRYDKRGVGQSGGRADSASLSAYADDARAVVKYLRSRKDVDRKRVALAGHGEGGWASMLAADHNKDVSALVLAATPGLAGSDLVLAQQQHALDRMKISAAERQAKIDLQTKIDQAVITGAGWGTIPAEYKKQADTPWFRSVLTFDPAKVMPRVRQPLLIVQGDLDQQVLAAQADRLAQLARSRKAPAGNAVTVVHVPGVNHLLVPAATGESDEYPTLADKNVSKDVLSAIVAWLRKTL